MRGFYLILGVYIGRNNDGEPGGRWLLTLDLGHYMPIEWRMGCALTLDDVPAQAREAARRVEGPNWPAYDIAAYRVTGPTTAELVWHKPAGHERGQWVRAE